MRCYTIPGIGIGCGRRPPTEKDLAEVRKALEAWICPRCRAPLVPATVIATRRREWLCEECGAAAPAERAR
ncbi:MAG: hypothetical protein ACJ79R_20535 [Anaeromyxobacteraceae bacterium]